jgi:hypothetical protein
LIKKFGPLSTEKIFALVQCFHSLGVIGTNDPIKYFVSLKLNELMLKKQKLIYASHTGLWHEIFDPNFGKSYNKKNYPKLNIKKFEPRNTIYTSYGAGSEFVYVMYETESRINAILKDRASWLLKVGRTNNVDRRISEISQSGPNSLVVGMVFKTNYSKSLEKFIHERLTSEHKKYEIPRRKEWFNSNLAEIFELWREFENSRRFL